MGCVLFFIYHFHYYLKNVRGKQTAALHRLEKPCGGRHFTLKFFLLLLAGTNTDDSNFCCIDCKCISALVNGCMSILFDVDEGFTIVFLYRVALISMFKGHVLTPFEVCVLSGGIEGS